jgi:peptidoglycan-N-acetylglucosamine deacetylase
MKTLGFCLLLLSTVILFGLDHGTSYRDSLQLSIHAVAAAESLEELYKSPYSPENTFINIIRKPIDQKNLCSAFLDLQEKDLALFEPMLNHYQEELNLECFEVLMQKISSFHQVQSKVFLDLIEKDKKYEDENRDENGKKIKNPWSNIDNIEPIAKPIKPFFKGEVGVDTNSGTVVYQRDLITGTTNHLNLRDGEVILTFDDGPHPTRTNAIIDILNRYQLRAVFFAVGTKARQHHAIIAKALERDHVYGSHSQSHKNLPTLAQSEAEREIRNGHLAMVAAGSGEDSGFFRFPYGSRSTDLLRFLKTNHLASFFWNMDTLDWKHTEPLVLYNHIVSEINREKKGILLFHDVHQQTVNVLNTVLEQLQAAGYRVKVAVPKEWMDIEYDQAL